MYETRSGKVCQAGHKSLPAVRGACLYLTRAICARTLTCYVLFFFFSLCKGKAQHSRLDLDSLLLQKVRVRHQRSLRKTCQLIRSKCDLSDRYEVSRILRTAQQCALSTCLGAFHTKDKSNVEPLLNGVSCEKSESCRSFANSQWMNGLEVCASVLISRTWETVGAITVI